MRCPIILERPRFALWSQCPVFARGSLYLRLLLPRARCPSFVAADSLAPPLCPSAIVATQSDFAFHISLITYPHHSYDSQTSIPPGRPSNEIGRASCRERV